MLDITTFQVFIIYFLLVAFKYIYFSFKHFSLCYQLYILIHAFISTKTAFIFIPDPLHSSHCIHFDSCTNFILTFNFIPYSFSLLFYFLSDSVFIFIHLFSFMNSFDSLSITTLVYVKFS